MTLKPGFDDEFQPKAPKRFGLVALIGRMMMVLATCGAAISVAAGTGKAKRRPQAVFSAARRPVQNPQVRSGLAQTRGSIRGGGSGGDRRQDGHSGAGRDR